MYEARFIGSQIARASGTPRCIDYLCFMCVWSIHPTVNTTRSNRQHKCEWSLREGTECANRCARIAIIVDSSAIIGITRRTLLFSLGAQRKVSFQFALSTAWCSRWCKIHISHSTPLRVYFAPRVLYIYALFHSLKHRERKNAFDVSQSEIYHSLKIHSACMNINFYQMARLHKCAICCFMV